MIILQKKQTVKVHQVAMELLAKTKKSPFIAILMLAKELGGRINPETLREKLFPNLPLAVCRNLLVRLKLQGYFVHQEGREGGVFVTEEGKIDTNVRKYIGNFEQPIIATELNRLCRQYTVSQFQDWINQNVIKGLFHKMPKEESGFELTGKGQESAADKSMWVGEKGIYNVYTTKTPFLEQRIIGIEPVVLHKDAADDRDQKVLRIPYELSNSENQEIYLKKTEYRIEKIDNKCFQLPNEDWTLKLSAMPKQKAMLSIKGKDIAEFEQEMVFDFEVLEEAVLEENFQNNFQNGYILTPFSLDNTLFIRDCEIVKPKLVFNKQEVTFEKTTLKNIKYRPVAEQDAQNWYLHLLTNNIQKYFLLDSEFDSHSVAHTQLFQPHFSLVAIKRKQLISDLSKDKGTFYQRAKLETIDYLNY